MDSNLVPIESVQLNLSFYAFRPEIFDYYYTKKLTAPTDDGWWGYADGSSLTLTHAGTYVVKVCPLNGYDDSEVELTPVFIVVGEGSANTPEVTPAPEASAPAAPASEQPTVIYFAKSSYTRPSIVDALRSIKVDSSFRYRATIAAKNGITRYKGTSEQNIKLLNLFKEVKLIKP